MEERLWFEEQDDGTRYWPLDHWFIAERSVGLYRHDPKDVPSMHFFDQGTHMYLTGYPSGKRSAADRDRWSTCKR